MKNKKTSLSKSEKEKIKNKRPSGIMSDEEWAKVQGMTPSELTKQSSVGSFLDDKINENKP